MKRPLTRGERSNENRRQWYSQESGRAAEERGEKGRMDFWVGRVRGEIARLVKRSSDADEKVPSKAMIYQGYTLVNLLFLTALQRAFRGKHDIWNDLVRYAEHVVKNHPPDH